MKTKWKTVSASVQGESHKLDDICCQDSCFVEVRDVGGSEFLIAACADGAGSAQASDEGSRIACEAIVDCLREFVDSGRGPDCIDNDTVGSWYTLARDEILRRADCDNMPLGEFASTLLMTVAADDWAVFAQIGDGAIVTLDDQEYGYVFWPHSGEYANTTNFLTDVGYLNELEWRLVFRPARELVLFSDGLERLILQFETKKVHEPFIEPMLRKLRQSEDGSEFCDPLERFLQSDSVNERTNDDKTLILATRLIAEDEHAC